MGNRASLTNSQWLFVWLKNITILQDNSSSKPHSLSLDFSDLVILEDLHFVGIARTLFHTLF